MKIHDLQTALRNCPPSVTFTPAQILRKLDAAIEELDEARGKLTGGQTRIDQATGGRRTNRNRTPRFLEECVCHMRAKGYLHREIGKRLDLHASTVAKIAIREGVS